jgi:dihydroorotase
MFAVANLPERRTRCDDREIDVFDRERVFIDTRLIPLRHDFPESRIVFEHITTQDAAD